jgi:hypothetical protein
MMPPVTRPANSTATSPLMPSATSKQLQRHVKEQQVASDLVYDNVLFHVDSGQEFDAFGIIVFAC